MQNLLISPTPNALKISRPLNSLKSISRAARHSALSFFVAGFDVSLVESVGQTVVERGAAYIDLGTLDLVFRALEAGRFAAFRDRFAQSVLKASGSGAEYRVNLIRYLETQLAAGLCGKNCHLKAFQPDLDIFDREDRKLGYSLMKRKPTDPAKAVDLAKILAAE